MTDITVIKERSDPHQVRASETSLTPVRKATDSNRKGKEIWVGQWRNGTLGSASGNVD